MPDHSEKKLLAPVLDRLLHKNSDDDFNQPHQILRHLRESVRRDLEYLFNSRFRCLSPPRDCKHLVDSNLNYGLPNLSTINLSSAVGRKQFCRSLEETIAHFEPRFKSVKVKMEENIDNEIPTINFRVEATLHTNPAPEIIILDSAVNPVSQTVDVMEVM
ncbi:MAG: type VI secretion system baseplate subunit TssE [Cellvibrionaceae bacterium]|nr:type VI secretion system baseplate subunit TssE [Cellvibrionaceae bacterium]